MKKYPFIEAKPKELCKHNIPWQDPYSFLEAGADKSPVKELIESENKYSLPLYGEHTEGFQSLLKELKEKIKEEDQDVAEKIGDYYYYSKTLKDKEYEFHCRKKQSLDAPEEVYFDENTYAQGKEYFDLGALEIDHNQKIAAVCVDESGDELYSAFLLNLENNQKTDLELNDISADIEWANTSDCFYFIRCDESLRPYRVYKYFIQEKKEELVFEELNPEYFVSLSSTKDEKYILIESHGSVDSEIYSLDANKSDAIPRLFLKRQKDVEYYLEYHDTNWLILSNFEVENFAIYTTANVENQDTADWTKIITGTDSLYLSDFESFKSHLVVYERENALDKIRLYNWSDRSSSYISQPEECYHLDSGNNSNYESEEFHYLYSSLTRSAQYISYHFNTGEKKVLKSFEVPKHYEPDDYQSKRLWIETRDGKKLPLSLLWHKNYPPEKAKAAYFYAYAAYGYSLDCGFDRKLLSLIDRGFIYVGVHARGGSDLGRSWYEDGKYLNKKNSFNDVIDAGNYISKTYPNLKNSSFLSGGSAGGLLVGACINQSPKLFKKAILNVPFVDVVNTMLDTSQALTALEYEEWGSPEEEAYFKEMLSYSPYENIKQEFYPKCLIIAGVNDQRVKYWEALKYAQRLRATCKNPEDIFLYMNTSSGHSGSTGRYEYLKEYALEYNFLLSNMEESTNA